MPDMATRALFEQGRIYIPEPDKWRASVMRNIHKAGSLESKWDAEVQTGKTSLTFHEWLKAKGLR